MTTSTLAKMYNVLTFAERGPLLLAAVVDAWPTRAEPIKAGILAMIGAASELTATKGA